MVVCDRCMKKLNERAIIERSIKLKGSFVIFSETGVLCKDCWDDFKQFMKPIKAPKEADNGNK